MFSCLSSFCKLTLRSPEFTRLLHATQINPAARKGTREKARKKKVKVEVKKVGFIPHNLRGKDKLKLLKIDKHINDGHKAEIPKDDVFIGRFYRWPFFTIEEAVAFHRETNHPTMYGNPNALLHCEIELNMQGEKVTRFIDNFQRIAMIPHKFDHGEDRKIVVLTKGEENIDAAKAAGATLVGGTEIIKSIQSGEINMIDYQYLIAHPNIMPELVALRGILKRKFPNPKSGSLGINISEMVHKFSNGIQYKGVKDENQQNFGIIKTFIGTIDMDINDIKENIIALLKDVNSVRPKRIGKFITRVLLKCPPSSEQFKIDPFLFIPENNKDGAALDDDQDEDQQVASN